MGAVDVLPGTTQSSTLEKGDYDSSKRPLSLCQSLRIGFGLRFAVTTIPSLSLWDGHRLRLGLILVVTMQAGASSIRKLSESASCRLSAVGSIGRVSSVFGWVLERCLRSNDWAHKGQSRGQIRPADLSQVWVILEDGRAIVARYKDLNHPQISLWENRRHASSVWQKAFDVSQRRCFSKSLVSKDELQKRHAGQTRAAKLDNERDARQSKKHRLPRDPSREMFAIDTGNPDLPTYPIDDFDDFQRKN